jgi:hypothetical protein
MCVPQVWERFTDQCVYESDRFGGGSVMIWAGICHDGHTRLKIVQGTLNADVLPGVKPPTTVCTSPGKSRCPMALFKDWCYQRTPSSEYRLT